MSGGGKRNFFFFIDSKFMRHRSHYFHDFSEGNLNFAPVRAVFLFLNRFSDCDLYLGGKGDVALMCWVVQCVF